MYYFLGVTALISFLDDLPNYFWMTCPTTGPTASPYQPQNATWLTMDCLLTPLSSCKLVTYLITASAISQLLCMTLKYMLVLNLLIKNKFDNLTSCNNLKIKSSTLQSWSQGSLGTPCPHSPPPCQELLQILPNAQLPFSILNNIYIDLETVHNWFYLKHVLSLI